jgi:hypothetical protein
VVLVFFFFFLFAFGYEIMRRGNRWLRFFFEIKHNSNGMDFYLSFYLLRLTLTTANKHV